ncbi:alpha-glucuronidase family glycosyl hydrolase [Robiginitalea sediminis]|uniref:alpha-glucuronidase family glycosyl hydrolase n=1 Tax=Robiginitalea sediminis TaxID=1982593 RepID=UPI000B4BD2EC|nr:alpha-glucuronidase family glycosyl hydrolase [Robiginitalea sediminis]
MGLIKSKWGWVCVWVAMVNLMTAQVSEATGGYGLWLDYRQVARPELLEHYRESLGSVWMPANRATIGVGRKELLAGLDALLGGGVQEVMDPDKAALLVARWDELPPGITEQTSWEPIGPEGFLIKEIKTDTGSRTVLTATEDIGILYGVFRLLRELQTNRELDGLHIADFPRIALRMLNHWDNLDRTVERGYAGFSIWNWHTLPGYIDPRYRDYARANASIGINGTVLTNVNANAQALTPAFLKKVQALADLFRPYGIKVYLTARFSAPMELGGLDTADPLDPRVEAWWQGKAREIYGLIPDFGGLLVKANSEGQPGPQNYGRTHLEGANMLARALEPFGGLVIWRAFVYSEADPTDRAKQAFTEFVPFNGEFHPNVRLQVKNGPIDFQPREPIHPLFGAMPDTPMLVEFQITKEYLGFATHLAYLPKLFEEALDTNTHWGQGLTLGAIAEGAPTGKRAGGLAGVSNIGTDLNWTGHPFGQADWYGFGRLAWNPSLSSRDIGEEWVRMTIGNDPQVLGPLLEIMLRSREAVVHYMMPLGLHHLFDTGHHYGPGPWVSDLSRPEWNPVYYHQADSLSIGFDRTATGSNALSQYAPGFARTYSDPETCPEEYLLWFHHLPWDFRMPSGHTLWEALGLKYQEGVDAVRGMLRTWEGLEGSLPKGLYQDVGMRLQIQLKEAIWWKDACMAYFQSHSRLPYPEGMEPPLHSLDYYMSLEFPNAPGIRPRWD